MLSATTQYRIKSRRLSKNIVKNCCPLLTSLLSGSPILQNGKLVGAVSHIFVKDPTRGYAIFAENMLETAQHVADEKALNDAS
ncbi:MAG: hypothetical protein J6Q92_04315 [Oscillospiraceae bacterium]|nr:hypothetical protein [Oscillospiraceae bacterium]